MFIDSHAHLEGKRYDADRDDVLRRAKAAGVDTYLAIGNGDGPDSADCGIRLAEQYMARPSVARTSLAGTSVAGTSGDREGYPEIWASVGIHPHEASLANEVAYMRLAEWARHPRVIAWGEIGLDYYYDHSPREVQKAVFLRQMELAKAAKLPIIIHCRPSDNSTNAWDDCLGMLAEHWSAGSAQSLERAENSGSGRGAGSETPSKLGGILHCFTGEVDHARRALDLGFMISFAGNITFPKAQNIRDAAQFVPLDRMLIETDSPYLAPIPHRGQRNEPAYVVETARHIGQLRGMAAEAVGEQTSENFRRIFKLGRNATQGLV